MTIACVGDVHVGNIVANGGRRVGSINRRCRYTLDALDRAVAVANEYRSPFVVLGDLFDGSRPESAIITAVQESLARAKHGAHVLVGNHDLNSTATGDNACSPLAPVAKVYEHPTIVSLSDDFDGLMIPFQPGLAMDWLPALVDKMGPSLSHMKQVVMCLHLGISDGNTPYYLDGHDDTIPVAMLQEMCEKWKITHVVAGNWHWRQTWRVFAGGHMVQVGTLSPVRHTDDGFTGRGEVTLLARNKVQFVQVPGPRFLTVDNIDDMLAAFCEKGSPLFLRARLPIEDHAKAYEWFEGSKDINGHIELEVVEVSSKQAIDKTELGKQIDRLSDLPVDAAIFEVAGEVAAELELDVNRLNETVSECLREVS